MYQVSILKVGKYEVFDKIDSIPAGALFKIWLPDFGGYTKGSCAQSTRSE